MRRATIFLGLLTLGCGVVGATPVLIGFDELPTQAAGGVSISGVTFGFTVGGNPSTAAVFNEALPVAATYLDDRVLSGPIGGVLSLDFAVATSVLQFGVLLNTFDPQQPGAFVELFGANQVSLGITPIDTDALILFSEAQFSYSGSPITRALISFNTSAAADIFAIDNLQFEGADTQVPEPGALLLSGLTLLGAGVVRGIREHRNPC